MLVIGHRGAPAEAVENSRSSFVAALRSGAHMVETDLQLTLDHHLVVHHDPGTKRLFNSNRVIAREPLEQLHLLQYCNGDRLLTLAELLDLIHGQVPVNLELKAHGTGAALLRFLADQPYDGRLLISSPHLDELRVVRDAGMDIPLGPVADAVSSSLRKTLRENWCQFISVNRRRTTAELIQSLQALGLRVYVYTVNKPQEIRHFAAAGADGIFTDDPALAMRVLGL
jgi:glycerophosphoryl diester phosphodiesterase